VKNIGNQSYRILFAFAITSIIFLLLIKPGVKYNIEIFQQTSNSLLLKLKKKQEARDAVQKAILLGKSSGANEQELGSTYELVEKINKLD